MIDSDWTVTKAWQGSAVEQTFSSLEQVFQVKGKTITKDQLSEVILFEKCGKRFYIKRYTSAGKGLRKYLGKSRIRAEWENMLFFHQLGIPAANVVAYGEERKTGIFKKGALITEELENTTDLAQIANQDSAKLKDPTWLHPIINQVAGIARKLHSNRFIHTDFKWRNILATDSRPPQVYLIDCPAGYQWPQLFCGQMVARGKIKDLACLDKVAKYNLSRTQRMRFYKLYLFGDIKASHIKLSLNQKNEVRCILRFFEGRE